MIWGMVVMPKGNDNDNDSGQSGYELWLTLLLSFLCERQRRPGMLHNCMDHTWERGGRRSRRRRRRRRRSRRSGKRIKKGEQARRWKEHLEHCWEEWGEIWGGVWKAWEWGRGGRASPRARVRTWQIRIKRFDDSSPATKANMGSHVDPDPRLGSAKIKGNAALTNHLVVKKC